MFETPDGQEFYVFDCHTHMGESPMFETYDLPFRFGPDQMSALMAENGIDAVCGFSPRIYGSDYDQVNTRNIEGAKEKHQGRIFPFLRFNPNQPWEIEERLTRYAKMGAVGIKLHPIADGTYVVNHHPLIFSLLEHAGPAGIRLVLIHTGGHWCTTPALVADLAMHFPDLQFIIGHSGLHGLHYEAITFARRLENLWLDTSGLEIPHFVTELVRGVGEERVLFGSDAPFGSFRMEVEKIALEAKLTEQQVRAVLGENMKRLINLASN